MQYTQYFSVASINIQAQHQAYFVRDQQSVGFNLKIRLSPIYSVVVLPHYPPLMDNSNILLARKLGFFGLVPFILLTLLCWIVHPDWLGYFINAQLYYGIAILSFLGGAHWGIALTMGDRDKELVRRALIWGVVPTIIAWCSMANVAVGFLVQIVGFVMGYRIDKQLYQSFGLPEWFINLRLQLTRVVVTTLAFTFIAANVRAL